MGLILVVSMGVCYNLVVVIVRMFEFEFKFRMWLGLEFLVSVMRVFMYFSVVLWCLVLKVVFVLIKISVFLDLILCMC